MNDKEIIKWLLKGDVSIRYQVYRDLLDEDRKDLKSRIEKEGWGKKYLAARGDSGHWGIRFYQPKWTSTHYTILDFKNLCISDQCEDITDSLGLIIRNHKGGDGGINPSRSLDNSDVCICGMALNYFSYFKWAEADLESVVDFLLSQKMTDGGFNCNSNTVGARHSSLHTTISVLEGIMEYRINNYTYRIDELINAEKDSREFILEHRLFKSDKTGEIINKRMLTLSYPPRWKYDILRALDYFQASEMEYDSRMEDAIEVLLAKRSSDRRWKLQAHHPGARHLEMEKVGQPSRWNTLRALRVLKHYDI